MAKKKSEEAKEQDAKPKTRDWVDGLYTKIKGKLRDFGIDYDSLNNLRQGNNSHLMWETAEKLVKAVYPDDTKKQNEYRKKTDYPQRNFNHWLEEACKNARIEPPLTIKDIIDAQAYRQEIAIKAHDWKEGITPDIVFETSAERTQCNFERGLKICQQIGVYTTGNTLSSKTLLDIADFKKQHDRLEAELSPAIYAFSKLMKSDQFVNHSENQIKRYIDDDIAAGIGITVSAFRGYKNREGVIPVFKVLKKIIAFFQKEARPFLSKLDAQHSNDSEEGQEFLTAEQNTLDKPWNIDDFLDIAKKIAARFPECKKPKKKESEENKGFREAILDILLACNITRENFALLVFGIETNDDGDKIDKQPLLSSLFLGNTNIKNNQSDYTKDFLDALGLESKEQLIDLHKAAEKVIEARKKMFANKENAEKVRENIGKIANEIIGDDDKASYNTVLNKMHEMIENHQICWDSRFVKNAVLHPNEFVVSVGLDDPDSMVGLSKTVPKKAKFVDGNDKYAVAARIFNNVANQRLRAMNPEHSYEFDAMRRMGVVDDEVAAEFELIAGFTHDLNTRIAAVKKASGVDSGEVAAEGEAPESPEGQVHTQLHTERVIKSQSSNIERGGR